MKRVLVSPPVYYPVTLDEVKKHLRVDYTDDDVFIQALIVASTEKAEQFLRRRLITQTWKLYLDAWPLCDSILLPFGQLASVTHIKYTDTDDDQTTWSTDEYNVDTDRELGRVQLEYGYSWPSDSLHPQNPIEMQFVCGYGAHTPQTIAAASNASPIVLTTGTHGYTANDTVMVESVTGNTDANGTWKITVPSTTTVGLLTSSGNADWVSGGTCIKLDVPESIRAAIKIMIADMFENREDIYFGQSGGNLQAAMALLWPYRLHERPSA